MKALQMITKIISGGQTGADRAALDAAIRLGFPHGGWIPKGRRAEDGPLSGEYELQEMPTSSYPKRTEKNTLDSDGTLIVSHGNLAGGSLLTRNLAEERQRPWLHIDLDMIPAFKAVSIISEWIAQNDIKVLNVAGSRAIGDPEIYQETKYVIEGVILLSLAGAKPDVSINNDAAKEYQINLPDPPKTVDEAVDRLIDDLDLNARVTIVNMDLDEILNKHSRQFVYFKNAFGLWSGNKELIESCRTMAEEPINDENDATEFLIKVLWQKLRETHTLRAVK